MIYFLNEQKRKYTQSMPLAQFQKMFISVIADTVHLCVFIGVISEDDQVEASRRYPDSFVFLFRYSSAKI
jgi:hypothetical protein